MKKIDSLPKSKDFVYNNQTFDYYNEDRDLCFFRKSQEGEIGNQRERKVLSNS